MTKKDTLLLLLILTNLYCISNDKKILNLNEINPGNSLTFNADYNPAIDKIVVGKFIRSKLDNKDYDSLDLRVEFKKTFEKEEYKINNYFILPVTNSPKYWNNTLIFSKFSSIGLEIGNTLDLLSSFKIKLIWKNNFSFQCELPRTELRTFIFPISFTSSLRCQKNVNSFELGYNLLFRNKDHIEHLQTPNHSSILNKFYFILGHDIKLFNTIMNLCLDLSYNVASTNDENINILATIACMF